MMDGIRHNYNLSRREEPLGPDGVVGVALGLGVGPALPSAWPSDEPRTWLPIHSVVLAIFQHALEARGAEQERCYTIAGAVGTQLRYLGPMSIWNRPLSPLLETDGEATVARLYNDLMRQYPGRGEEPFEQFVSACFRQPSSLVSPSVDQVYDFKGQLQMLEDYVRMMGLTPVALTPIDPALALSIAPKMAEYMQCARAMTCELVGIGEMLRDGELDRATLMRMIRCAEELVGAAHPLPVTDLGRALHELERASDEAMPKDLLARVHRRMASIGMLQMGTTHAWEVLQEEGMLFALAALLQKIRPRPDTLESLVEDCRRQLLHLDATLVDRLLELSEGGSEVERRFAALLQILKGSLMLPRAIEARLQEVVAPGSVSGPVAWAALLRDLLLGVGASSALCEVALDVERDLPRNSERLFWVQLIVPVLRTRLERVRRSVLGFLSVASLSIPERWAIPETGRVVDVWLGAATLANGGRRARRAPADATPRPVAAPTLGLPSRSPAPGPREVAELIGRRASTQGLGHQSQELVRACEAGYGGLERRYGVVWRLHQLLDAVFESVAGRLPGERRSVIDLVQSCEVSSSLRKVLVQYWETLRLLSSAQKAVLGPNNLAFKERDDPTRRLMGFLGGGSERERQQLIDAVMALVADLLEGSEATPGKENVAVPPEMGVGFLLARGRPRLEAASSPSAWRVTPPQFIRSNLDCVEALRWLHDSGGAFCEERRSLGLDHALTHVRLACRRLLDRFEVAERPDVITSVELAQHLVREMATTLLYDLGHLHAAAFLRASTELVHREAALRLAGRVLNMEFPEWVATEGEPQLTMAKADQVVHSGVEIACTLLSMRSNASA